MYEFGCFFRCGGSVINDVVDFGIYSIGECDCFFKVKAIGVIQCELPIITVRKSSPWNLIVPGFIAVNSSRNSVLYVQLMLLFAVWFTPLSAFGTLC